MLASVNGRDMQEPSGVISGSSLYFTEEFYGLHISLYVKTSVFK